MSTSPPQTPAGDSPAGDKESLAFGHNEHATRDNAAVAIDMDELPKGYYYSPRFLGTFLAIGINLMASTGGFALIAPVVDTINSDIGPGPVVWVSLVYTLMLAVGLTLVGQLTDIFGRRYFFIGGAIMGMVGSIICSQAKSVNVLIGGETLIGLSASGGYSYAFLIGELVPMKYRFLANAVCFWFTLPTAGFGSAVSTAFILHTKQGWRMSYYFLLICNGVTVVLYFIFYFPPKFHQKHGNDKISRWIKNYDYVGMLLYIAGLVLFILGLSWGGAVHPWKSAQVIAPIIIGFLCLVALFTYEAYFTPKEPLIRIEFFKNRNWLAPALLVGIGASVYYSQAIMFPQLAATVYGAQKGPMWVGLVGCLPGIGITVGEIIGGSLAQKVGKSKYQVMVAMTTGTALIAAMAACTPDTSTTAIVLALLGTTAIGYNEAISLPICTICIPDQENIGQAAGLAGSLRSAISSVATAIYTTVLADREGQTIGSQIPSALINAGINESDVASYMQAVAAGADTATLKAIPGVTDEVIAKISRAYQFAYSDAFRTVFYVSIAFGVLGIIFACLTPNVDKLLTNEVAVRLNQDAKNKGDRKMKGVTSEAV